MRLVLLMICSTIVCSCMGQTVSSANRLPEKFVKNLTSVKFLEFYIETGGAMTDESIRQRDELMPKCTTKDIALITTYIRNAVETNEKFLSSAVRMRFTCRDGVVILIDREGHVQVIQRGKQALVYVLPAPDLIRLNGLVLIIEKRLVNTYSFLLPQGA